MLKNKKGFSLVELIVVIAILVVFAAVLIPSLLQYTENSRAQKDVSAMDEVVNAVQLAMADEECFDEMLQYSCNNNFMTYTDSSGNYGQQINDGEFWAPDGLGKATTITFNPTMNDNGIVYYELGKAYINDMTIDNGSTAQERIMEGQIIDENQCYLKDASIDGQGMSKLYSYLKSAIGETFANTSQTYKNSSFTVFIRFTQKDSVTVADVYGSFNGTNLHDGAAASKGSGTTEYDINTGDAITSISGGTMQAQFGTSDLIGTGTFCPSMTEERIEHNDLVAEGGDYQHRNEWVYDEDLGYYVEEEGQHFESGEEMPEIPQMGDIYVYGDYEYHFNQYVELWEDYYYEDVYDDDGNYVDTIETVYWYRDWYDRDEYNYGEWEDGWTVVVRDTTKSSYGQILTEINGYPVNGMTYTYGGCSNLTDVSFVKIPETTKSISYLFYECDNITKIPNAFKIPKYVNNAHGLFYGCENITTIPKTFTPSASLEDAGYMFAYTGIESIPNTFRLQNATKSVYGLFAGTQISEVPSTFVLPNGVTTADYMFAHCSNLSTFHDAFTLPPSLKNANYMFYDCDNLTVVPKCFYESKIETANYMFAYCANLSSIEGVIFPDTLISANGMFASSGITSIPSDFKFPKNASYKKMFSSCSKLTTLPDDLTLTVNQNMTSFAEFFYSCSNLQKLPDNFIIPSGAKDLSKMFYDCKKLTNLPNNFTIPEGVTTVCGMFYNCSKLQSLPSNFKLPSTLTSSTGYGSSCAELFRGCSSLTSLPDNFKLPTNIKSTYYMFAYSGIISLPNDFELGNNITDTQYMFYNCTNLTSLPLNFKLPTKLSNADYMFYNCKKITYLPNSFTMSNSITSAKYMFGNCTELTSVPSSFNISSKVTNIAGLFYNCSKLEVPSGQLTIPSTVHNMYRTFYNCQKLTGTIGVSTTKIKNSGGNGEWASNYGGNCFYNTRKPITLVPTTESCRESCRMLAATDNYNNVDVAGTNIVTITLNNQCPDLVDITVPEIIEGGYTTIQLISKQSNKGIQSFYMNGNKINGDIFTAPLNDGIVTISNVILCDAITIESEHSPYPNNIQSVVYGEAIFTDAQSLTVTLDIQTESTGCDWVYIYDKNGNKIKDPSDNDYKFGGTTRKTQTITVSGDYVKIVFRTDGSVNGYYGFKATITPNN